MRLGIDFGTTNSSVARYDGAQLFRLGIDPANDNPNVLPSLIYVDRAHRAVIGTRAALEYLKHETGRTVRWEERRVGEIDVVAADMSYVQTVSVLVDTAAHGRLLQYVKTALRDPTYQGTQIFDRFYTLDELIALILYPLKRMAEQAFAEECTGVVIGRPVRFSDDPMVTERAEEILFKAARWAGFHDVRFELEPVGATYHYHRAAPRRQTAFIFDFGGGTLDLTVAEVGGSLPPRILVTHGVLVGGDDLDRRVMQSLRKYFGVQPRDDREPVPPHLLDLLDNWQTMPLLSRPANLKLLDELKAHCDTDALAALRTLATQNLGFQLFRVIEQTKKQLSDQ
ncbi:MAG: Hsp70 family protein, partial [Chloroflexota bacterium]